MSTPFSEVYSKYQESAQAEILKGFDTTPEAFAKNVAILEALMSRNAPIYGPRLAMSEALMSADASILFPRVFSDVLLRPREPLMIGQSLLSRTINVDVPIFQFPAMGALRAFDVSEGGKYKEQYASFTENHTEIKVGKTGLIVGVTDEVVQDSMWDILALYVEAAGFAMMRLKEEKIFTEFSTYGHVVFDNNLESTASWTGGKAYAQTRNFTVTFDDLIDTMGTLVAHEYIPTDIVVHAMSWPIIAKDPVLRNIAYHQGALGQGGWTAVPNFNQQMNLPWAINYQISPFIPYNASNTLTSSQASGLTACGITDMYILDRNNACLVLQRTPMGVEDFRDPSRDIQNMKVNERYGVGVLNAGKGICVIKNVRVDQNWAPHQVIASVTPS